MKGAATCLQKQKKPKFERTPTPSAHSHPQGLPSPFLNSLLVDTKQISGSRTGGSGDGKWLLNGNGFLMRC